MATPQVIAARTMDATQRLNKARAELQDILGIEIEDGPVTNKDAGVARFQQIDNIAAFLEAVTAKVRDARGQGEPSKITAGPAVETVPADAATDGEMPEDVETEEVTEPIAPPVSEPQARTPKAPGKRGRKPRAQ